MVRSPLSFLHTLLIHTFVETPIARIPKARTVRLLPYELVPHMDTNSRMFHKAQATIAKQVPAASTITSAFTARKARFDRLFNLTQGIFLVLDF
jgi:hypothetical protein